MQRLLHNYTSTCTIVSAHHVPPVTLVDDGIVIINDQSAIVNEIGKSSTLLNGTYLITFKDEVRINGTLYANPKKDTFMSPEIPWHTVLTSQGTSTVYPFLIFMI